MPSKMPSVTVDVKPNFDQLIDGLNALRVVIDNAITALRQLERDDK